MRFRIDLKIFLLLILFYFTRQIEIYATMMLFAIIHEFGHLLAGIFLGMKIDKLEIMPFGMSVQFRLTAQDFNKRIIKSSILSMKKIVIALAGPITNAIIIVLFYLLKREINLIIYANFLLIIFNLLPMYPLDGGRIMREIIYIFFGKKAAEKIINRISFLVVLLLTMVSSIIILYLKNISIFLIIIFLWTLYIKQDIIYKKRNKIYETINRQREKINI